MGASAFFNINNNQGDVFTVITQSSSATTFDPIIAAFSSKDPRIDYGDGTAESATSFSHTYSDGGSNKTVKLSIDRLSNISSLDFFNDNLVGEMDLSKMVNCSSFSFHSNTSLTGVTFPTTTTNINNLNFFLCDINGVVDLTTMPNIGGVVFFANNTNITGFIIPSASTMSFTDFRVGSCNISGRLDFSGYTGGFGGNLDFSYNSSLTGITFPTNSTSITNFSLNSTGIIGELDISGFSGMGGVVQISSNSGITSINFPSSSNNITLFSIDDNDLLYNYNLTSLSGIGGSITAQGCANLTGITFPSNSNSISTLLGSYCPNILEIDISTFSGISGFINFENCSSLSAVTMPTVVGGLFTSIYFNNCSIADYVDFKGISGTTQDDINIKLNDNRLPSSAVNHILYDIDNFGWTGGTITTDGAGNGAPDGSSGGFNGTGATASLLTKGWTVTTN